MPRRPSQGLKRIEDTISRLATDMATAQQLLAQDERLIVTVRKVSGPPRITPFSRPDRIYLTVELLPGVAELIIGLMSEPRHKELLKELLEAYQNHPMPFGGFVLSDTNEINKCLRQAKMPYQLAT